MLSKTNINMLNLCYLNLQNLIIFKNVLFEEYFISVLKMLHKAVRFLRTSKVVIIKDILRELPKFALCFYFQDHCIRVLPLVRFRE